MKSLVRDEKGQALVLVLILLLVGGLIIAPLLAYMGTGLIAGEVYERRTDELYAADAGVEDAVWSIQYQQRGVNNLTSCKTDLPPYDISVNGKNVTVTITYLINEPIYPTYHYRVVSTATGDGSRTEIEAYVASVYGDYSGITNHVITSQGEITLQPGANVTPSEGEHAPAANYTGDWPTPEKLALFYRQDVAGLTSYPSDTINLNGVDREIGPLYRNGTLDIKNSSDTPATLTLTGTIYITGDTRICYNVPNNKDMTLDLNSNTIFVESNSSKYALAIGDKCTIIGPGAIIAVGDIYFKPKAQLGGEEDPIFIMSVSGETLLQPGGDFYGSVAGSVEVQLQPNTSLNYPEGGFEDFNFPGCSGTQPVYIIASWDINQQ